MEKFNNKGTKCPTLWLGKDKMTQNKAKTFVLVLTTVRPDIDDKNVGGADDSSTDKSENDKPTNTFYTSVSEEQKPAIAKILNTLTSPLTNSLYLYWL